MCMVFLFSYYYYDMALIIRIGIFRWKLECWCGIMKDLLDIGATNLEKINLTS